MKRFFILVNIILLYFVINVQGLARKKTKLGKNISVEFSASDNQFIVSGASGMFNDSANKETGQRLIRRLFPTFQKFPFGWFLINEYDELNRENKISSYVFIAECSIVRLEGTDIIHPFNYFW